MGKLDGPALIERGDARIEIGNYRNDKQEGVWKYRRTDGSFESIVFKDGKKMK